MTSSRADTDRELFLDQEANQVRCKVCGAPMEPEHGIIHASDDPPGGVTWWQCTNSDCDRRVKEDYSIDFEKNLIVTLDTEEV